MDIDALIRSIALRDCHYMFFLGAGASISSGVPSAVDCIWNWKQMLFLTGNKHLDPRLLGDPSLPHVQRRIQRWLDEQHKHPRLWADEEYSHYAEQCYPLSADRRHYFKLLARRGAPHLGYRTLGVLTEAGRVKWLWTTNFDDLVERGRPGSRSRTLLQVGMDCTGRLEGARREGDEFVQVFLHGDYRYDPLRNTDEELAALDAACGKRLVELCRELPLVVIGYSGRDKSVMDALTEAYSREGQGGLYWTHMAGFTPAPRVQQLVEAAKGARNQAEFVPLAGFDEFMVRLARVWLRGTPGQQEIEEMLAAQPTAGAFSLDHLAADFDWILGNAYPIQLPGELYQFSVKRVTERGAWRRLKDAIAGRPVEAGLLKGKVFALGRVQDIQDAFGADIDSRIEQVTLSELDLTIKDGVVRQIMLSGLTAALAARGLERAGRNSLGLNERTAHAYKGRRYEYSLAVDLSFDYVAGQTYLVTHPDVLIHGRDGGGPTVDEIKAVKRDILWRQRNVQYMAAVMHWREALFGRPGWRVVYPPNAEAGFEFSVSRDSPVCARRYSARPKAADATLTGRFGRFEKFKAFAVEEPSLRFAVSPREGKPVNSPHPIRGLIDCGGPLETYHEALHPSRNVRLGVVCLQGHERLLGDFLRSLNQPAPAGAYDDAEYVQAFPGFEDAFKCGLAVPSPGDAVWRTVGRVKDSDRLAAYRSAVQAVTRSIREIEAAGGVDVVLVYVPTEWASFERIVDDAVHLDLHDQVKAFCVERHLRSQLLREAKVRSERTARIRWWLSLALFTKSGRVPWMLDSPDERVAYTGIGYAVEDVCPDKRIVLGCCHVFNSSGIGMRFRLSELRNPTWQWEPVMRRRNPFMSREDAYQLGVRTRQLFFESHHEPPDRVLVCKRTPFLDAEVEGILSALSGLKQVDLVSIECEDAWRFCAYDPGRVQPHGFPVRRGTGVVLDARSMLLWLHGNVVGLTGRGKSYFQGKSRIPAPVRVTRYSGNSPVETLARDLIALTKMDWNTFALYQKMPVTVTTPGTIARIARLLERLPADSYDYRLFM